LTNPFTFFIVYFVDPARLSGCGTLKISQCGVFAKSFPLLVMVPGPFPFLFHIPLLVVPPFIKAPGFSFLIFDVFTPSSLFLMACLLNLYKLFAPQFCESESQAENLVFLFSLTPLWA